MDIELQTYRMTTRCPGRELMSLVNRRNNCESGIESGLPGFFDVLDGNEYITVTPSTCSGCRVMRLGNGFTLDEQEANTCLGKSVHDFPEVMNSKQLDGNCCLAPLLQHLP